MPQADKAMFRYELTGYVRGGLPLRFVLLAPIGVFLTVWTWSVAPPFAGVVWLVCIGLEPRINNIFYESPREPEALSLFPLDWKRVLLIKNGSTALIGICALVLISVVSWYFSPESPGGRDLGDALLYLSTICFPVLSFGNEASLQYPRKDFAAFSAGFFEALWMSLTLLAVSIPYILITELLEIPWLCLPYAAGTAVSWYLRSVSRTAARLTNRPHDLWLKTETSSKS